MARSEADDTELTRVSPKVKNDESGRPRECSNNGDPGLAQSNTRIELPYQPIPNAGKLGPSCAMDRVGNVNSRRAASEVEGEEFTHTRPEKDNGGPGLAIDRTGGNDPERRRSDAEMGGSNLPMPLRKGARPICADDLKGTESPSCPESKAGVEGSRFDLPNAEDANPKQPSD